MTTWQVAGDTALLIIDPQNGFCPGGNLPVTGGDEIMPVINELRAHFNTVVISQDWHPDGHISFASSHPGKKAFETIEISYGTQKLWPDHCEQGSYDAEFYPGLTVSPKDLVLHKGTDPNIDSYSAFFENDCVTQPRFPDGQTLTEKLHGLGITKLVMAGLAFDYCVGWSALDAVKEGFEVTIIEDATRGIAPDNITEMKGKLAEAGIRVVRSNQLAAAATTGASVQQVRP